MINILYLIKRARIEQGYKDQQVYYPSWNATNIWIAPRQNSHWNSKDQMQLNFSCIWSVRISARILSSCNAANICIAPRQNSHWNSKVMQLNFSCIWACKFQHVFYRVAMQLIFGLHLDKIRAETRRFKKINAAQFQLHLSVRISARILSSCNAANIWTPPRQNSHWNSKVQKN